MKIRPEQREIGGEKADPRPDLGMSPALGQDTGQVSGKVTLELSIANGLDPRRREDAQIAGQGNLVIVIPFDFQALAQIGQARRPIAHCFFLGLPGTAALSAVAAFDLRHQAGDLLLGGCRL